MTENKISLKAVYENVLSEAYTEKNDKLLPDDEVVEKIEKLIAIDARDYEAAIDSKDSKNYYDTYLRIFYGINKCENEKDLGKWKDPIIENNPWKKALENSEQFRSIADSDRNILEPLIKEEIKNFKNEILSKKLKKFYNVDNIVDLLSNNPDAKEKIESIIDKGMATKFYEAIFRDFEHAFDGNFENPRVLILGINPKFEDIIHESYNLFETYSEPFNKRRKTLINKNENKDYYFKDNGFFFSGMNDSHEATYLKSKFKMKVTSKKENTPYALLEFYPYATKDIKEWYGNISISEKKIIKYMQQKKFLPSQIWLLCLLTFTIKKALFDSKRELYIFCTKKEKTFQKSFVKPYFEDLLRITPTSNVKILLKKDDRNRSFNVNNINPYFENSGIEFAANDFKEFFRVIWKI